MNDLKTVTHKQITLIYVHGIYQNSHTFVHFKLRTYVLACVGVVYKDDRDAYPRA